MTAISVWSRLDAAGTKRCIQHDEAVSLIAAAGKLLEYNRATRKLKGHWVSGSEWKRYIEISEPWRFNEIHRGAIKTDVHPPLYYWLLHVAGVFSGALLPSTGAILNTILHALGLFAMFALVWRTTRSVGWAAVAVAIWTFSFTSLSTTFVARQYELLAVLGVATAWALLHLQAGPPRAWLWAALLTLLLTCALLVHVHGALLISAVVASAGLGLTQGLVRRARSLPRAAPWQGFAFALATSPAAIGLFLWIHPDVFQQIEKLGRREQIATEAGVESRLVKAASALAEMFDLQEIGEERVQLVLGLVAMLALLPLTIVLVKLLIARDPTRADSLLAASVPLLFLLIFLVGTVGAYVAFVSQRHAMGDRYLGLVWPFIAIALAHVGWLVAPRCPIYISAPLILAMAVLGVGWRWRSPYLCEGVAAYAPDLQLARTVVVDTSARGHLGQLLPHLRRDAQVFVAHGRELERKRGPLLKGLMRSDAAVLIHMGGYGVSRRARSTLLALAREAGLRAEPAGRLDAILQMDQDLVGLVIGRGDLRGSISSGFLQHAGEEQSSETSVAVWLVRNGRVFLQQQAEDGYLTFERDAEAQLGTRVAAFCTPRSCVADLGGDRMTSSEEGFAIMVRSLHQQRTLLKTQLPINKTAYTPRNMWVARRFEE